LLRNANLLVPVRPADSLTTLAGTVPRTLLKNAKAAFAEATAIHGFAAAGGRVFSQPERFLAAWLTPGNQNSPRSARFRASPGRPHRSGPRDRAAPVRKGKKAMKTARTI